jgi:hypothetical protein
LPYSNAKTIHSSTYQVGKRYYEKLAPHLQKYNSPFLHLTVHLINIITHLSINDFEKAKAICANNISFFEQKPYTYNMPIRVLLLNHLICCIHLKNYKEGKAIVLKAEKYIIEGTFPWFRHQELHLALAFHAAFYELAPNIVYTVLRHSRFKSLKASLQERWRINEAYIHLLIQLGKITTPIPNKKRFNLGKFLNQVSIYEKDKKGLKVCLVIIQLLFRILRKEEDQLNKQVDSTKKYCSRYLNSTAGLRSKYFINMLLQVPKANFHPVASERKAKRYYDKLKAHPLKLSNQAQEIEIIPFEDLWELILERLQSIR